MWWILGRCSTRIPLAHHQFCPKLCILVNFWTTSICLPMQYLILGSRSSFQGTTQNLKTRKLSRARDWWLLHHQSKINVSMRNLPISIHSINLIWLWDYQLFRNVEHLFHCEIFCIFDGMPIVWVILHHEYRCSQCWRHKHSPYHRMFVAVFCCIFWGLFLPLLHLIIHPAQEWSGS